MLAFFALLLVVPLSAASSEFYNCSPNATHVFRRELVEEAGQCTVQLAEFYSYGGISDSLQERINNYDLENVAARLFDDERERQIFMVAAELQDRNVVTGEVILTMVNFTNIRRLLNYSKADYCVDEPDGCSGMMDDILQEVRSGYEKMFRRLISLLDGEVLPECLDEILRPKEHSERYVAVSISSMKKSPTVSNGKMVLTYDILWAESLSRYCTFDGFFGGWLSGFINERLCDGSGDCYKVTAPCSPAIAPYYIC